MAFGRYWVGERLHCIAVVLHFVDFTISEKIGDRLEEVWLGS